MEEKSFIDIPAVVVNADLDYQALALDLFQRLENSYAFFHQFVATIDTGLLLVLPNGTVWTANRQMMETFLQMSGVSGKSYRDLSFGYFLDRSRDGFILNLLREALENGIGFENVTIDAKRQDQSDVLIDLTILVFKSADDVCRAVLLELKEEPADLRHMLPCRQENDDRLKKLGSLSAGVIHEIKNSMNNISAITQVLEHRYEADDYLQEHFRTIMSEISSMGVLLAEFLSFSSTKQMRMQRCSTEQLCREVISLVSGTCTISDIEIVQDYAADMPSVMLDVKSIKQVVVNLLSNSIDAINALKETGEQGSDYRGRIRIATGYDPHLDECMIMVEDNGGGMCAEVVKNITKAFYTTKRYGTGLGVFISNQIINNHGGSLLVDSTPGEGTKITVVLPELTGLARLLIDHEDSTILVKDSIDLVRVGFDELGGLHK